MKITCEKCNNEFEFKQDMLKEEYIGAMITSTYYNCPKCDKKYVVCVMNGKARKLKKKMKELREVIRVKSSNGFNCNSEVEEIKKVTDELTIEMDRINKGKALV